ncbi:Uncharacterised protein [Acinetobacter baumannii]|nr:Uncharacterised protein [Acinetobacter baumannii]
MIIIARSSRHIISHNIRLYDYMLTNFNIIDTFTYGINHT